MEIIRDQAIVSDAWIHLHDDAALPESGDIIVSLPRLLTQRAALDAHPGRIGVRLAPDDEVEPHAETLGQLPVIAVEFPKFTDGRGYSTARLLRERFGYRGELRAVGHVLRDQLFYLHRVGFNAFELAPGKSLPDALEAFADFSVTYQPVGAT